MGKTSRQPCVKPSLGGLVLFALVKLCGFRAVLGVQTSGPGFVFLGDAQKLLPKLRIADNLSGLADFFRFLPIVIELSGFRHGGLPKRKQRFRLKV
jgi:hypothetical protein